MPHLHGHARAIGIHVNFRFVQLPALIMADVINETAAVLNETAKNATAKIPATPEGMATAYGSLVVMALVPIFFGSLRSVRFHKEQKVRRSIFARVDVWAGVFLVVSPYGWRGSGIFVDRRFIM